MPRTLGIRLGTHRFEAVVLEGTVKKPRVVQTTLGEVPVSVDGSASGALREALKDVKKRPDAVCLSIDSGLAAFRNVTVPFEDREKIESVLKFEVESQLPQWDIDEVVCDSQVLGSTGVESNLLVTTVQKADIEQLLGSCEAAGHEAHEAELEAFSAVNAAHYSGAFSVDEAAILVHVGEASTAVSMIDGGQLRTMRAIHIGGHVSEHEPLSDAPEGEEADPESAEEAELPTPKVSPERRLQEAAVRVRRELARTLTGAHSANPIGTILLTGTPLPGLDGGEIDGVPIQRLEVFPEDADVLPTESGALTAAFGAAIGAMGGGLVSQRLRREELRHTGKFERIELPLAILCLLFCTVLLVQWIVLHERARYRSEDLGTWLRQASLGVVGDPVSHPGHRPALVDAATSFPELVSYLEDIEQGEYDHKGPYELLEDMETRIKTRTLTEQRLLGQAGDIEQPLSALEAATLVLNSLHDLGDRVGRFSIRELNSDYRAKRGSGRDTVAVRLKMTFFGPDSTVATANFSAFREYVEAQPWLVEFGTVSRNSLTEGEPGIAIDNIEVVVDPRQAVEEI